VGRDYEPVVGQWYENLEENEVFQVLSVDPDEELIEIQYENGDMEEIDLDAWQEMDLDQVEEPEGWSGADDEEEEDDDFDLDEDEEDDDEWDDDEDDDDFDEDFDEDERY